MHRTPTIASDRNMDILIRIYVYVDIFRILTSAKFLRRLASHWSNGVPTQRSYKLRQSGTICNSFCAVQCNQSRMEIDGEITGQSQSLHTQKPSGAERFKINSENMSQVCWALLHLFWITSKKIFLKYIFLKLL